MTSRSMVSRYGMVLFLCFVASAAALVYTLSKFSAYEKTTLQALTGDQKNVVLGHVVESKLRALIEQVPVSVSSKEANDSIRAHLKPVIADLGSLGMEGISKGLEKSFEDKIDSDGDLFFLYRNLKTSVFNLYRLSWNNKWMSVGRNMGGLLADLENVPYHGAERGAQSVPSRIMQTVGLVTSSDMSNDAKVSVFGLLNQIKSQASTYVETYEKSQKMKLSREAALKDVADKIKKVNESSSRGVLQFLNENHADFIKSAIVALAYALFAFCMSLLAYKRLSKYIPGVTTGIRKQLESWNSSLSSINAAEFEVPKRLDDEWTSLFDTLEKTVHKVNAARKEDLILRRLLNVPVLLINQSKQAVYWNSAFSILAKTRAVEEMGLSPYLNVFRVSDAKGAPIDVVDKAFAERKEVQMLVLLRSGGESVPVFASCTPLTGQSPSDGGQQSEYVLVYLKDLREEFKRIDTELERQLSHVHLALGDFKGQKPIEIPPTGALRAPVLDSIKAIHEISVDREQRSAVLYGQIEMLWERVQREGKLKNALNEKTTQLNDEVLFFQRCIGELKRFSEQLARKIVAIDEQETQLKGEYAKIKSRGERLIESLKESESLLTACVGELAGSHEHLARVRTQEKTVGAIVERTSLMNVNNSIIGSKKDLTADDIFAIAENLSQIISQFDRCNHVIGHAVAEIEVNLTNLKSNIESDLNACKQMALEEREVLGGLLHSEKMLKFERQDLLGLSRELHQFNAMLTKVGGKLNALEGKSTQMSEIGKASLTLQGEMEKSFKGVLTKSQTPV